MNNAFSIDSFSLANIIEVLVDGQTDKLRQLLMDKQKTALLNQVIYKKNEMGRTLLHKICHYGYAEVLKLLIEASENSEIIPLDFNLKDEHGDTCLSLAMSKCYWVKTETSIKHFYLQKRQKMVELLLPRTDLSTCVKPNINNPLHWCIFYGDQVNGLRIFKECPSLLLKTNQDGQSPIELLYEKQVKLGFYKDSVKLVKQLCLNLIKWIMKYLNEQGSVRKDPFHDVVTNEFFRFLLDVKEVVKKDNDAHQRDTQE